MSVGRDHAVLLTTEGEVFTFGSNQWGQLGISSEYSKHYQAELQRRQEFSDGQDSDDDHVRSRRRSHTIQKHEAVSHNLATEEPVTLDYFENPVTSDRFEYAANPVKIRVIQPNRYNNDEEMFDRVKYVVCGDNHSLALTEQGQLWSWGIATHGQLGVHKSNATVNLLQRKQN